MLLDTTFLIDAERSQVELDEAINDDDDVAIAAVTVAELLMGVTLADTKHQTDRATFVEGIGRRASSALRPTGRQGAHAELLADVRRSGRPRGAHHDLIIAAASVASRRTVPTADSRGFADLPGVQLASG